MGNPGLSGLGGQYSYTTPVFILPPWGSQGVGISFLYPPIYPAANESHLQARGVSLAPMYHGTTTMLPNNTRSPFPFSSVHVSDIPDMIAWFKYLDRHEQRNKDGIVFAPFGEVLRAKGFVRLSQLMPPIPSAVRSANVAWNQGGDGYLDYAVCSTRLGCYQVGLGIPSRFLVLCPINIVCFLP